MGYYNLAQIGTNCEAVKPRIQQLSITNLEPKTQHKNKNKVKFTQKEQGFSNLAQIRREGYSMAVVNNEK